MHNSNVGIEEGSTLEQIYADLKQDVAARLKNACSEWTAEDFEAIVEKVTRTAMKYGKSGQRRENRSSRAD
jgi:hypothetical protein